MTPTVSLKTNNIYFGWNSLCVHFRSSSMVLCSQLRLRFCTTHSHHTHIHSHTHSSDLAYHIECIKVNVPYTRTQDRKKGLLSDCLSPQLNFLVLVSSYGTFHVPLSNGPFAHSTVSNLHVLDLKMLSRAMAISDASSSEMCHVICISHFSLLNSERTLIHTLVLVHFVSF